MTIVSMTDMSESSMRLGKKIEQTNGEKAPQESTDKCTKCFI